MLKLRNVMTIVRKDLLEAKNDQGALVSIIVVPFILAVMLPILVVLGGTSHVLVHLIGGLNAFIEQLPKQALPSGLSRNDAIGYAILMYFFVPFFLLIPVMIATILASSSFTGEKERKTIEGLLYTPITNQELMLGKILASAIPSILVTWIAMLVYGIIVDIYSVNVMNQIIFPNFNWIVIAVCIIPLITFLAISLIVSISHRVKTSKSAQSISVLLILPIMGFLTSQSSGIFLFGINVSLILVVVLIIIDILVYMFIVKMFNRDVFITRT
ncbi:ABC transporter permease [Staphylococcus felis]|uniref:ABC transporter permease n=1 Tax=Staphylococcus felis TaxID=46127 RepID=A0AAX1RUH2_9STAP|nr:ABC transporter permease subunit [Staphylococcus felis]REH75360.1 ABC transporter permease [Staphylococcus felis]REH78101.1 ABC transporter permease [Staphylococcus felis]REH82418.1 ABC transporter permease [Staphylococcus felis]REH87316.1 ABC transporter permease [Staphylococcus felis]REI03153.1 ABC transporter permease [Staphylococcus felis]